MIRRKFFLFVFFSLVCVVITACGSHRRPGDKRIQELIKKSVERNYQVGFGKPYVESVTIIAIGKPSKNAYGNKSWPIRAQIKGYTELRLGAIGNPGGGVLVPGRTERNDISGIHEYTLYKNNFGEWNVEPRGLW